MPLALMNKFGFVGERDIVLSTNGRYFYMQCGSGAAEKLRAILEETYRKDLLAFTQLFSFLDEKISDVKIDDKRGGYYYSTIAFLEESFRPVQSGLALSLALLQKKPIFVRQDFLLKEEALRDRIGSIALKLTPLNEISYAAQSIENSIKKISQYNYDLKVSSTGYLKTDAKYEVMSFLDENNRLFIFKVPNTHLAMMLFKAKQRGKGGLVSIHDEDSLILSLLRRHSAVIKSVYLEAESLMQVGEGILYEPKAGVLEIGRENKELLLSCPGDWALTIAMKGGAMKLKEIKPTGYG